MESAPDPRPEPSATRGAFAALRSRNFAMLWLGMIVSNTGTQMQSFAQSWLLLKLTGTPTYLGYLGAAYAVPMILLPLIGGAVADRSNRIRLLKITQTGMMLVALVLTVLTWTGVVRPWHFLVLASMSASLLAFDNPTRQSLIPDLVTRRDLMNATSLHSAVMTGSALIGPAVAGILYQPLGPAGLFAMNTVSYLAVLIVLFAMRDVPAHPAAAPAPLGERLLGGLRYAYANRLVGTLLLLALICSVFGQSYVSILAVFARDVWHVGERGFGFLQSAAGAGALIGAFGVAAGGDMARKERLVLIGWASFCGALLLFAWSPWFSLALVLQAVIALSVALFRAVNTGMIQLVVPDDLRGRVMSLQSIAIIGCRPLGALMVAPLATFAGARIAVTCGVVVAAAAGLLLARPLLRETNAGTGAEVVAFRGKRQHT
jgi:MFS family permease